MSWRSKSYEVLPALSVRGANLRQSLRTVTIAWMYGVVWMSCVSGEQTRAFCRMLGFNDLAFGILAAVPFVATFGQLIASVVIERTGLRKIQFIRTATAHRMLWLVVACVPLLGLSAGWSVPLVLVVLAVSGFLAAMAIPGWMTWMGDLIPRRIRGRYFAKRAQYSQVVQIVTVIAISILLDAATVPGAEETPAGQPVLLWTICGIFAVGAIFGTVDVLLFRRIREVLPTVKHRVERSIPGWRDLLIEPLKDRVFRHYVCYGATIAFTMSVSQWFFWRFAIEWIGFSKLGTNVMFMVVGPVSGTIAAGWWGKLQDRWGRRPVLIVATVGTLFSILPWLFMTRTMVAPEFITAALNWVSHHVGSLVGRPGWQLAAAGAPVAAYLLGTAGCILGGACWIGIALANTGIVLGFADGHGRSKYVAASAVLISLGGILGGVVGGIVAQLLEPLQRAPVVWACFVWNNWQVTFLLAFLGRLLSILWLVKMPDPNAKPVRHLLRYWTVNAYNGVVPRLFYRLRIYGWGRTRRHTTKPGRNGDADKPGKRTDR